jgi:hypothetical protein
MGMVEKIARSQELELGRRLEPFVELVSFVAPKP